MSCLFAVTTDFPACSAALTQSYAGLMPPATSMTMEASDARMASAESVHVTVPGTQSTRFLATSRLKMCVSWICGTSPLQRMRATAWPTVPNPISATRAGFTVAGLFTDAPSLVDGLADG